MAITVVRKGSRQLKSCGLVMGGPNQGKTLLTTQFEEETALVLSVPGEKGVKTIPLDKENIEPIILRADPLPENAPQELCYESSREKYQAMLNIRSAILKGDYGEYDIFFLDGLSKFYEIIMDIVSKGRYLRGDPFEERGEYTTRLYGNAHILMRNYWSEIYDAQRFTYAIATCWERLVEPDQNASEGESKANIKAGKRTWIPALPGQLGYVFPGEFDWTIRAASTRPGECTTCETFMQKGRPHDVQYDLHPTYQLSPHGDTQCVGVKGKKIPRAATFIHQNWTTLRAFIS